MQFSYSPFRIGGRREDFGKGRNAVHACLVLGGPVYGIIAAVGVGKSTQWMMVIRRAPEGSATRKGDDVGTRYFGASVARVEDPRLLRGSGRFVDDIKLPGLLHAALVLSLIHI